MTSIPSGEELANDPGDNPCFGCGPDNPAGLQMRFFDDGDVVRAPLELDERYASWPGFANMGVIALAMMEAGAWAIWERLGPSRPASAVTYQPLAPMPLGVPATIEARVEPDGAESSVSARCLQGDKEVGRIEWRVRRMAPEEAAAALRVMRIPRSLQAGFEALAAKGRAPALAFP